MKFLSAFLALFFSGAMPAITHAQSADIIILDVRTPGEFSNSHVKGAINIDFYSSDFRDKINQLDKTKDYKVYCRSGNRSGQSVSIMKTLGFKKVENFGSLGQAAKILNLSCDQGPC